MYIKTIPFKDFRDKPRNQEIQLNLTEREVFKLTPEFKQIFDWRDRINVEETTELDPEEVREFYDAFESVLLAAWGVMSEDGLHFRKAGRYDFEESALFNAVMVMFVTEPEETTRMINDILPKGMEEMIKKASDNMEALDKKLEAEGGDDAAALRRQIAELEARVPKVETTPVTPS